MNITSVSALIAVIGVLVVVVNLLTEVIKKATWSKLPTNIVVEANCRTFITLCAEAGYSVLVTGTVRDTEYQEYCASHGLAAKTATRPTFHSVEAGLAFDI